MSFSSVRAAGYDTDHDISSISEEFFVEAAKASKLDGAEAIFISCTATKALNVIETIEAETGLPVVVSNQAAFWHALSLAGRKLPISGYGRLLREMW
ncbi:Asp/Glu/Hydantoin racemase family protein (plasmid) [Sinorhizobium americanum CCGM7]|nr:Asp/Glu/Hydantoin racemase family protein [Sinorhizobium americanum CCGM7]